MLSPIFYYSLDPQYIWHVRNNYKWLTKNGKHFSWIFQNGWGQDGLVISFILGGNRHPTSAASPEKAEACPNVLDICFCEHSPGTVCSLQIITNGKGPSSLEVSLNFLCHFLYKCAQGSTSAMSLVSIRISCLETGCWLEWGGAGLYFRALSCFTLSPWNGVLPVLFIKGRKSVLCLRNGECPHLYSLSKLTILIYV